MAQRAGAGKPTLYRRWASKRDLIITALESLADSPELSTDGILHKRVTAFMEKWWHLASQPELLTVTKVLLSLLGEVQHHPKLGKTVQQHFLSNRRSVIYHLFQKAIKESELRPDLDIDLMVELPFSPLLVRRLVNGGPVTHKLLTALSIWYLMVVWTPGE